jgi:DNA polymerase-4
MSAYSEASDAVFEVFRDTAPLVEGISIDEAFLDVRGMQRIAGTPKEIAVRLRGIVRERVGLPITVGVATTKHLAKVASAVAKPDGLLLVPPGEELAFLHPLPIERLWGVGESTSQKLRRAGIATVGEIAGFAESTLIAIVGQAAGRQLHALAHNRDPRRVRGRRRRSMGSQRALGRRKRSHGDLDAILMGIVDRLARRLRAAERVCRTVVLRLRFDDFTRATRSRTFPQSTARTATILTTARELLAAELPTIDDRGATLLGLTLTNLSSAGALQLALPFDGRPNESLDLTLDEVRDRYGTDAITRAVLLGREAGLEMPLLPDWHAVPAR